MFVAALSKKGRHHQENEDAYLVDIKRNLFAVADGVTTYGGGKLASKLAIRYLRKNFDGNLKKSFSKVNNLSLEAKKENPQIGLTTLTAVHIKNNSLEVCYVIDSLAFLITDKIRLITPRKKTGVIGEHKLDICYSIYKLKKGDYVLLATDGITDNLTLDELLRLVKTNATSDKIVKDIMKITQQKNPNDDKTILAIRI